MDPVIEYFFGPGDGSTTRWSTPADATFGDSGPDAVRLDFDGDGRLDDAMWDTDADGVADVAALDTDDDDLPDAFYRDSGAGLWDRPVDRDEPGAGLAPDPAAEDAESGEGDGPGVLRLDLDADGDTEAELVGSEKGGRILAERLYIDSDGDGDTDVVLVDLNGDGVADAAYDKRDPRFTRRGR
ncbi:hypothetical protein [Gordonia westfalica]|uniref:Pullulanase n=1 Tax=Gordonia westfalica TaxID=158898 RepID=A0A1H2KV61_9ACTN|nr:hypothetical protein [Gordonia westfalica]SDU72580.1 hypothetical protein SAMN04488548_1343793 [Gordonia westfalica]